MQLSIRPSGSFHITNPNTKIEKEFTDIITKDGVAHGLLYLDTQPDLTASLPELNYWLDFTRLFLIEFCAIPDVETKIKNKSERDQLLTQPPELNSEDLSRLLLTKPLAPGSEYLNENLITEIWNNLHVTLVTQIIESKQNVDEFFASRHQGVSLQGRVWFHLAENKTSEDTPFAFLTTYSNKISETGKTQHLPLNRALEEYSAKKDKQILMRLLAPLNKASKESVFLKALIDSNDIYHPQMWTPREAFKFFKDIPIFEKSGILVRVPNWWRPKNPNRPQVTVSLGNKEPKGAMGLDALLDFNVSMNIGDLKLSEKEIHELLAKSESLVFFKGQWVEVDSEKLNQVLKQWKQVEKEAKEGGVSFLEGMRMLSGLSLDKGGIDLQDQDSLNWRKVETGPWLDQVLSNLKSPENSKRIESILKKELKAELRPYQTQGVQWMYFLDQLKLGACLADDMGLGKTIQVISLLLVRKTLASAKTTTSKHSKPNLLIVPASLIGNWKSELNRFAPSLNPFIAHSSEDGLKKPKELESFDLVITTYGSLQNVDWLKTHEWGLGILDEAQAIKNPDTKQTKVVKLLKTDNRLVLTGTPIENSVSDLWSLFDFIAPGLLGAGGEFSRFIKANSKNQEELFKKYGVVRKLVQPYILRRLKTDKSIIKDLPDKTELKTYCNLTKAQIFLYEESVKSLKKALEESEEGMKRRGIIFSYMMRFKQICNHPSHWLKDGDYKPATSGKFARLSELIEVIKAKQEKVLIFTQFQEMTEPLSNFLTEAFGQEGLILHGQTPVGKRKDLVEKFQSEDGPPHFVLSLKAGGTGLNLTQASHVIHFDRWWNPAIENQATDRAFRIGQKRNVMVHKFICQGTLEEKIDALIESKVKISQEIVGKSSDGGEMQFTEMSNSELINLVSLDLKHSAGESLE